MEESKDDAKILTPLRAIRAKCLDCSGGSVRDAGLSPVCLQNGEEPEQEASHHDGRGVRKAAAAHGQDTAKAALRGVDKKAPL